MATPSVNKTPQTRSGSNSNVTPAKKTLTPEQRAQKQLIAKIKRLNMKLAKVKAVAVDMHGKSTKANEFSARQVEKWSKDILSIINKAENGSN